MGAVVGALVSTLVGTLVGPLVGSRFAFKFHLPSPYVSAGIAANLGIQAVTWLGHARTGYEKTSQKFACPQSTAKQERTEALRKHEIS